mgnify:CR=1 FL=1
MKTQKNNPNPNPTPKPNRPAKVVYAAYGSNLNIDQMSRRCPDARPCGTGWIKDYRLCFRGVADIAPAKGERTPVGFWEITERCESALDRYEGFPNLYQKIYFKNDQDDAVIMAYIMNRSRDESSPSASYYETIVEGYGDFGFDYFILDKALHDAFDSGADLFELGAPKIRTRAEKKRIRNSERRSRAS